MQPSKENPVKPNNTPNLDETRQKSIKKMKKLHITC